MEVNPLMELISKKAYPWAEYRIIDVNRDMVPISATKIREMLINGKEVEADLWKI